MNKKQIKEDIRNMDAIVGRNVLHLRKKRKVTRLYMAAKLGISQQQLHKYEAGHNRISSGSLHKISEVLNVPFAFFFVG